MKLGAWPRAAGCALLLAGPGCTGLREIPRSQYAAQPERQHVRVTTDQGLVYEFDYARVHGDSLVGFMRRDLSSPTADFAALPLALTDISTLSTRGVDWHRTALIGGGVVAGVVAAALAGKDKSGTPEENGGGTGPGGRDRKSVV